MSVPFKHYYMFLKNLTSFFPSKSYDVDFLITPSKSRDKITLSLSFKQREENKAEAEIAYKSLRKSYERWQRKLMAELIEASQSVASAEAEESASLESVSNE